MLYTYAKFWVKICGISQRELTLKEGDKTMEPKFKLVREDELPNPQYYTFCSTLWKNGKQLGLDFEEIPDISADVGLYILNKRYGRYNQTKIDPYKQTFEYVFHSNKLDDVYYTIYDYKGYMSCGFGIPKTAELTEDFVNTLNNELRELIEEAFQPVEVYDFIYEDGNFTYR